MLQCTSSLHRGLCHVAGTVRCAAWPGVCVPGGPWTFGRCASHVDLAFGMLWVMPSSNPLQEMLLLLRLPCLRSWPTISILVPGKESLLLFVLLGLLPALTSRERVLCSDI